MITNERQFRITRAQLEKLEEAAHRFDMDEASRRIGSRVLAEAELGAIKSQASDLSAQIHEYEALKSGNVRTLTATSLAELPTILIKARIAQRLSQSDLAQRLKMPEQQVQRYESEAYASASLRRLNEVAAALHLSVTEIAELRTEAGTQPRTAATDWNAFPVKEMYKRGWFSGFQGSVTDAWESTEELVTQFVTSAGLKAVPVLQRQRVRTGSVVDQNALIAWHCRILLLARELSLSHTYDPSTITEAWIRNLVRLSREPQGPALAKKYLEAAGIPLIVEPHLPGTHLDGAAFLDQQRPLIGMTLRYDREDNFWFVLLHELIHVIKHLRRGEIEQIYDDLDAQGDSLEREADELAAEALIPNSRWHTALARYVRTKDSVTAFANELSISAAIVAGRIRREADNYVILDELVGHGEVRKCFPTVRFST